MNRIRSWVRAFFGFSRNETNAFLILLPLMFIIIFIIPTYKSFFTHQKKDYSQEKQKLDSIITAWAQQEKKDSIQPKSFDSFTFNPNTVTKEELLSLGFSPYVASRLENYRAKGGKFVIKSDLLKLYGMDTSLYTSLYSWIDLPTEKPIRNFEKKKEFEPNRKQVKEKFDLNQADSVQLITIYGIGGKLSARIIKFRDRLGGFVSSEQLKEVYGLDSAVINELKNKSFIAENFQPKRMDINSSTEQELATHPYIKYTIAKAITAYRFQHGNFKSIDDLTNIAIIDKATFEKIRPYLALNH
jgi:competence protein ComEA